MLILFIYIYKMATQTIILSNNNLNYISNGSSHVKLNFNQTTLHTNAANSVLDGHLTVAGNHTLAGHLAVTGNSALTGKLAVTGNSALTGHLTVAGNSALAGNLAVTGNSALTGKLDVTGVSTLTGNLAVTGTSTLTGDLTVAGNFTVSGSTTSINTTELTVKDLNISMGQGNATNLDDMSINMMYNSTTSAGLKRIAATGSMVLFKDKDKTTIYGEWFDIKMDSPSSSKILLKYGIDIWSFPDNTTFNSWYLLGSSDETNWVYIDFQDTTAVSDVPEGTFVSFTVTGNTTAYMYYRFVLRKYHTTYTPWALSMSIKMTDNTGILFGSDINVNRVSSALGGASDEGSKQLYASGGNYNAAIYYPGSTIMGGLMRDINSFYTGTGYLFSKIPDADTTIKYTGGADLYADLILANVIFHSDLNLKKNIVTIDGALDKLDGIRGVYHDWINTKQSEDRQIGVIAQEVQAVYPELVSESENGFLTVNYPKLTAVLLQSIKELKTMVLANCAKQAL